MKKFASRISAFERVNFSQAKSRFFCKSDQRQLIKDRRRVTPAATYPFGSWQKPDFFIIPKRRGLESRFLGDLTDG